MNNNDKGKDNNFENGNKNKNENENQRHLDEIVALKENVLRLDFERSNLQNVLSQREKKIELLEEDLRGPVPYETGRYKLF